MSDLKSANIDINIWGISFPEIDEWKKRLESMPESIKEIHCNTTVMNKLMEELVHPIPLGVTIFGMRLLPNESIPNNIIITVGIRGTINIYILEET